MGAACCAKGSNDTSTEANVASENSASEARYGPIYRGHEATIKDLFDQLDKNRSGDLDKTELKRVVEAYNGETFNEKEFFGWFDIHGRYGVGLKDGKLDLQEFSWYLADVAEGYPSPSKEIPVIIKYFLKANSPEEARYRSIYKEHEVAIKALFRKMDKNSSGDLDKTELQKVVLAYTGEQFDEKQFFEWFDLHGSHGAGPDGKLDFKEFCWYLADIAESFPDSNAAMPAIIQDFESLRAA